MEPKKDMADLAEETAHQEFKLTEGRNNLTLACEQVPDLEAVVFPLLTPLEAKCILNELKNVQVDPLRADLIGGDRDWIQALHDKILSRWEYDDKLV